MTNCKTEAREIILAHEQRAMTLAPTVAMRSAGKKMQAFCVEYEPCDGAFLRELWQKLGCEVESTAEADDFAVVRMNPDQLLLVKSLDCVDQVSKNEALRAQLNGQHRQKRKTEDGSVS